MNLSERLSSVRKRISDATETAGRPEGCVKLLAVSKRKPAGDIRAAYEAGQRDFGENYVQELREKQEALEDLKDLRWHMIGQLQRNKIKYISGWIDSLHTVDSLRLTETLLQRLETSPRDRLLRAMVEVNVSGEDSKSGCRPDELGAILRAAENSSQLSLCGLMTVPPRAEDPQAARPQFDQLRNLRDEHGGVETLPELSIGMSRDLEVAIAAGATWVRIGSAIFGER